MNWLTRKAKDSFRDDWEKGDKVIITDEFPIWEGKMATITEVTEDSVSFDVDGENDGSTTSDPDEAFETVPKGAKQHTYDIHMVVTSLEEVYKSDIERAIVVEKLPGRIKLVKLTMEEQKK